MDKGKTIASETKNAKAERAIVDHVGYLDAIEYETRNFIQDRADAIDFLARGKAAYGSLEGETAALIASIPRPNYPIDRRNAQVDLRNALMDAQYRANDIDRELADGVSGHLAFATSDETCRLQQQL